MLQTRLDATFNDMGRTKGKLTIVSWVVRTENKTGNEFARCRHIRMRFIVAFIVELCVFSESDTIALMWGLYGEE